MKNDDNEYKRLEEENYRLKENNKSLCGAGHNLVMAIAHYLRIQDNNYGIDVDAWFEPLIILSDAINTFSAIVEKQLNENRNIKT